jgi:hypothetical protein
VLAGPARAPAGAITVPAGNNSGVDFGRPGATYWFAPGRHTLGGGQYDSIVPGARATFVGAPGAVLSGQGMNHSAFGGHATGVTIKHLTIEFFGIHSGATHPSGDNNNEGVVNHDSGHDWTVTHNTVRFNAGAGVFGGSGDRITYNCLTRNGQYGFSFYEPNDVYHVVVDHNEISFNNTYNWERKVEGCGCTGGGKFWRTHGAAFTDNYVHHNYSVGMWADTDNTAFKVEGNYFADNEDEGVIYEISYNALFRNNTFIRNALGAGKGDPGFPHSALYISESGSDPRVPGRYAHRTRVVDNEFKDNWSGVVLWENADRYCASSANSSTGDCTMVKPGVANLKTCKHLDNRSRRPYIDDCRWKTQNVEVSRNLFSFDPSAVGKDCTPKHGCGYNGVFSQYGTYPPYGAEFVENDITFHQENVFARNVYHGPWRFMVHEQNNSVGFAQWQAAPYHQDNGSIWQHPARRSHSPAASPSPGG